jgi:hypothetical protein
MPLSSPDHTPSQEPWEPVDGKRRRTPNGVTNVRSGKRMKRDDIMDDNMDTSDTNSSGPLQQRRPNFGAVSNGFNRNVHGMDHCKPGSVKKLVIKNLRGILQLLGLF